MGMQQKVHMWAHNIFDLDGLEDKNAIMSAVTNVQQTHDF